MSCVLKFTIEGLLNREVSVFRNLVIFRIIHDTFLTFYLTHFRGFGLWSYYWSRARCVFVFRFSSSSTHFPTSECLCAPAVLQRRVSKTAEVWGNTRAPTPRTARIIISYYQITQIIGGDK